MVTQSKEHIRRTVPLRVKLSPDISAQLDAIARPRGITAATLGALAVGEYVERFMRTIRMEDMSRESEKGTVGGFEGSSAGAEAAAERSPVGASTERVSTAT